jgi:ankyrin repeat protein
VLEAGANVIEEDDDGAIPLHFAYSSAECVALLINAYPASVNAVSKQPLHQAARFGTLDFVCSLLDAGSNVDTVDKNGHTPLFWALRERKRYINAKLVNG